MVMEWNECNGMESDIKSNNPHLAGGENTHSPNHQTI